MRNGITLGAMLWLGTYWLTRNILWSSVLVAVFVALAVVGELVMHARAARWRPYKSYPHSHLWGTYDNGHTRCVMCHAPFSGSSEANQTATHPDAPGGR